MDSINRNQEEQNHEDLRGTEAAAKIKELVKKAQTCFFCTHATPGSNATRPMNVLEAAEDGSLWFLSANDSYKNQDLKANPEAKLYFQGATHSDFLFLQGQATISEDKQRIKQLWNPILKVWFTEGEDDPRISVIKFTPVSGYYWDNKSGKAVAAVKVLVGALTGKTLDDSIEGRLNP